MKTRGRLGAAGFPLLCPHSNQSFCCFAHTEGALPPRSSRGFCFLVGLLSSLAFAEAAHAAALQNGSRIHWGVAVPFKLPSQIADAGMEIKVSDVPFGVITHQCSPALYLVGLRT